MNIGEYSQTMIKGQSWEEENRVEAQVVIRREGRDDGVRRCPAQAPAKFSGFGHGATPLLSSGSIPIGAHLLHELPTARPEHRHTTTVQLRFGSVCLVRPRVPAACKALPDLAGPLFIVGDLSRTSKRPARCLSFFPSTQAMS